MKKFILGIAGYIGSGKTTAAKYFEEFGAKRIDADEVVSKIYEPNNIGFKKIVDFFGEEYLKKNKELNRKKLARNIFNDPKKLKILNSLIHPMVTSEIQKIIDKTQNKFIVLEAVYFEKKFLQNLVTKILWIECDKNIAFKRASKSENMSREMFEKIYRLQVKPTKPDYTIVNNAGLKELKPLTVALLKSIPINLA